MKILLLTHGLPVGGAEMVICHLARSLRTSWGVEVEVGCLDEIGNLGAVMREEGFPVEFYGRAPGTDLKLPWRIARHVRRRSIDVIHAHQMTCYVYGTLAKILTRRPLVFTEHGRFHPDVSSPRRRLFNRLFAHRIDQVAVVSDAVRRSLVSVEGFPAHDIAIVHNGIDPERFRRTTDRGRDARSKLGIPPNALVIGTVARLDPIKNQELLIRAVARIREQIPSVLLLIVGDGDSRERLETVSKSLGMRGSIRFLGMRHDVPEILPAFDVFTLPSLSEGIPMTLLEAMAASLPIVATAVGGIPEILRDGIDGWLISNGDLRSTSAEIELSEALRRTLMDQPLRSRLGSSAAERVRRDFSLDTMVQRYHQIYQHVLS